MGQKVNPVAIRLGGVRDYSSVWYADRKDFAANLRKDYDIRKALAKATRKAEVAEIKIESAGTGSTEVILRAARPGNIIGKKGEGVERLRRLVETITGTSVHISIVEIRKPELNAQLVADSIAVQLERRVMFRRCMKRAVSSAMKAGAKGIRANVAGRLGGAEIARTEWYREGRVPLHTFRADIEYGFAEAKTTYGIIGVKVWIFKGEQLGKRKLQAAGVQKRDEKKS